jgi:hypothetical protein
MAEFKPKKLSFTIDTPDEGEQFIRGCIIAQSNNSSPIFPMLIESTNAILEEYRREAILEQVEARDKALEGL